MKVICTHQNASTLIDGVKFEKHEDGMISEEISDEKAEEFLAVPHIFKAHKHHEKKADPVKAPEQAPPPAQTPAPVTETASTSSADNVNASPPPASSVGAPTF